MKEKWEDCWGAGLWVSPWSPEPGLLGDLLSRLQALPMSLTASAGAGLTDSISLLHRQGPLGAHGFAWVWQGWGGMLPRGRSPRWLVPPWPQALPAFKAGGWEPGDRASASDPGLRRCSVLQVHFRLSMEGRVSTGQAWHPGPGLNLSSAVSVWVNHLSGWNLKLALHL